MEDIHLSWKLFVWCVLLLLGCVGRFGPGGASGHRVVFTGVRVLPNVADEQAIMTTTAYAQAAHQELILDCVYRIQAAGNTSSSAINNKNNTNGDSLVSDELVVKWFRNKEATPFYTWISATGSRLFHHAYIDLVDTRFKYNDVPMEMYRAVRFPRTIRELSGNFSCEVLDAQGGEMAVAENNLFLDTATSDHLELYIYDLPSVFELRLNLSQRTLHCLASTREKSSQVRLDLYQIDYDSVDMPLARTDFNASGVSPGLNWKRHQKSVIVEGTAALQNEDVVINKVGNSRTFFCDLTFTRIQHTDVPVVLRRTIRIAHEVPDTDYGEVYGLPEAAAAWGSSSSAATITSSPSPRCFHSLFDRRKIVPMTSESDLVVLIVSLYITIFTLTVNMSTTFTT